MMCGARSTHEIYLVMIKCMKWCFLSMVKMIKERLKRTLEDENFSVVFKGSLIVFLAKVTAIPIGLLISLIIAKNYGAGVLGDLTLITSFLTISGLFVTVGLNMSLLYLIPEQFEKFGFPAARSVFLNAVKIVMLTGFLISCFSWFNVSLLANQLFNNDGFEQWLSVAVFFITAFGLSSISLSAIRALRKVELFAALQLLQPFVMVVFLSVTTIWFYNVGNPFYAYFLSLIIGFICLALITLFLFSKKKYLGETPVKFKYSLVDTLKVSWPMFLSSGMHLVISQTDIVMLGTMTKSEEVGVYAIVMKLGLAVNFILTSINMVLGPKFAELYNRDDMEGLVSVAKKSSKLIFYCTAPFLIVLIMLGEPILGFFGKEFIGGYLALFFVALGQFINCICGSVGYFMNMTGNQQLFCRIVFFGALLNIVLNSLLIPVYGLTGAAIASFLSVCLWNIAALLFIKYKFGFYMGYFPVLSGLK